MHQNKLEWVKFNIRTEFFSIAVTALLNQTSLKINNFSVNDAYYFTTYQQDYKSNTVESFLFLGTNIRRLPNLSWFVTT